MPYILVNTSKKLSDEQKDAIASALGQQITLIPGKTERLLMVDLSDGDTMYYDGQRGEFAYVDVEIFGTAPLEAKQRFTEAIFEILKSRAGLESRQVYVTIRENAHWGMNGTMI